LQKAAKRTPKGRLLQAKRRPLAKALIISRLRNWGERRRKRRTNGMKKRPLRHEKGVPAQHRHASDK